MPSFDVTGYLNCWAATGFARSAFDILGRCLQRVAVPAGRKFASLAACAALSRTSRVARNHQRMGFPYLALKQVLLAKPVAEVIDVRHYA